MLQSVHLRLRNFHEYRRIIAPELFDEVLELAEQLKGKRFLQINSTATRGGVAEILESTIPTLRDLGMHADWQVMHVRPGFYDITKAIHNGLQGAPKNITAADWELYETVNRDLAEAIDGDAWDFIMIHDPQPMAALKFMKNKGNAKYIWRYHGDSSVPNPHYQEKILDYLAPYDASIFSMKQYILEGYKAPHTAVTPVAIDPLTLKNLPIEADDATHIIEHFGIDLKKPLVTQISRFDPWKDPIGVIQAWQIAKRSIPDLQLALVGNMAADDPQGSQVLAEVRQFAHGMQDIHILSNRAGARAIKSFQMMSDVAVQKSLREGFGLTVSEALWAGTPVIGGNVGGIRLQIENGKSGYLVDSVVEAAQAMIDLVSDKAAAKRMGEYGREVVREKFLMPRLIRDDLKLLLSL